MNCTIALFINIHRAALYSNKYTLRRWTIHKFHSADRCRLTADCAYYFVLNFCRRIACNTFEDALAQWRGSQRTQSHIGLQTHAHTTITHMHKHAHTITHLRTQQSHTCTHNYRWGWNESHAAELKCAAKYTKCCKVLQVLQSTHRIAANCIWS